MLDIERDQVLFALCLEASCCRKQCLVIGFRTARCEVDLVWSCGIDAAGYDLSCLVKLFLCALSVAVKAVRVAVEVIEAFDQFVARGLAEVSCRGIVSINFHLFHSSVFLSVP